MLTFCKYNQKKNRTVYEIFMLLLMKYFKLNFAHTLFSIIILYSILFIYLFFLNECIQFMIANNE